MKSLINKKLQNILRKAHEGKEELHRKVVRIVEIRDISEVASK